MAERALSLRDGSKGILCRPLELRFWEKVARTGTCWKWIGAKTTRGYGQIWVDGKNEYAHRVSYRMHKGEVPSHLELDHLCENPSCVNPDHLEAVTHTENIKRAVHRIDYANSRKTHCKHGHALSGDNLRKGQGGRRRCKECARRSDRNRRARAALSKAHPTQGDE